MVLAKSDNVALINVCFSEATKITLAPGDVEVTVGEDTLLQCSASYDPSFDITFIWSVDSYIINFDTDFENYEQLMVRMEGILPIMDHKASR